MLTVAFSYVILIVTAMVEVYGRLGANWTWRSFVSLAAFTFGLYSMRLMWQAYAYASRMSRHDQKSVREANRLMSKAFGKDDEEPQ